MKALLLVLVSVMSLNASALELNAYKSTTTNIVKIDDAAVEKVWAATQPACLKDGSKIIGVNKAFLSQKLGYRDCSSSDAAKEKARMMGYSVTVIKLVELSDAKAKQVLGK